MLDSVAGGLYFYNARYYDPALGRFISADTIVPQPGNPQSLNRYSYVGNQPTVSIDPSGHAACAAGDTACWQEEWRWKDRWYKAHGHTGGNWFGSPDDPEFEDEQILRETVGEAGISIAGVWDFASQLIPMATGIIRCQLAGYESHAFAGIWSQGERREYLVSPVVRDRLGQSRNCNPGAGVGSI